MIDPGQLNNIDTRRPSLLGVSVSCTRLAGSNVNYDFLGLEMFFPLGTYSKWPGYNTLFDLKIESMVGHKTINNPYSFNQKPWVVSKFKITQRLEGWLVIFNSAKFCDKW